MKKNLILLVGLLLITILWSCGKTGGDKYIGTWKSTQSELRKITVTKAGETAYTVQMVQYNSDPSFLGDAHTSTATYQDGNLVESGTVILSYSNGKIISNGEEYVKEK